MLYYHLHLMATTCRVLIAAPVREPGELFISVNIFKNGLQFLPNHQSNNRRQLNILQKFAIPNAAFEKCEPAFPSAFSNHDGNFTSSTSSEDTFLLRR